MRLYEITTPKLFLCTNRQQHIGGTVKMDSPCNWLGDDLEAAIEAQRPEGNLPRSASVILSLTPLGTDFTYVVEPNGQLDRQNIGWLRKLQDTDIFQSGVLAHYANGYWSGRECPEARDAPWEYRSSSVRIIRRVGGSARD